MLELWVMIPNILSISIISPSGENTSRISFRGGSNVELDFLFEKTKVYVDYRLMVEKTILNLSFSGLTPCCRNMEDRRRAGPPH